MAWLWVLLLAVLAALALMIGGTWWLWTRVRDSLEELSRLTGRLDEIADLVAQVDPGGSDAERGDRNP